MAYARFISLRYLKASRRTFLSTTTLISGIGVILGVTALTAVVSVTGGFQRSYRDRILGVYPHILLYPHSSQFPEYREVIEAVEATDGVESATAFLRQHVMIYTGDARSSATVRGLEYDYLVGDESLRQYLSSGSLEDLEYDPARSNGELPGILLGIELARTLGAEPGDTVTLVTHLRGVGVALGASQMAPKDMQFRVAGIMDVGYVDFDSRLALTDLRAMQEFTNNGDVVTGIDVRVDDIFEADEVSAAIVGRLQHDRFLALAWQEVYGPIFRSLELQKWALTLVMTFIVLVASFNIISTLVIMVLDKTKEIAILKSMGATRFGIMRIFMYQGVIIGVLGTLFGLLGGYVVCRIIANIEFGLDPTVYKISELPVEMRPAEFGLIALVAIAISFLATIYPSWRAGRMDPVEGLRYD
ncbi:MAG: ABC transporter permease [Myxococcales bacterium]|nr:ABC transporter permease [Myxococcales bacterium]